MASTQDLIEQAVNRLQAEVPALGKLKLVVGLELRGRGDIQHFRVEVPGPKISKSFADDERLEVSIPRSHFNELAADGRIEHWREAFEQGHIKVQGDPNVQKLFGKVIGQAEARSHLKRGR
ncbi:MAG: hypothetical protein ACR2G3_08505 [Solirubrobacterales bacterium]